MKLFIPPNNNNMVNLYLTDEQLLVKNKIILNHLKEKCFLFKIDTKLDIILKEYNQYFEDIQEYECCNDITLIRELNNDLFN